MEKIMSIYWFAILFIVAGAIVYMVSNFYGEPYDVRVIESDALVYQISNCLVPNLYFEKTAFTSDDFFSYCNLTLETEDYAKWKSEEQFFVSVVVSNFPNGDVVFSTQSGDPGLNDFCEMQKDGHQKKLPYCLTRKFYSVDKDGKQYFIEVKTIIDKGEKNAKL